MTVTPHCLPTPNTPCWGAHRCRYLLLVLAMLVVGLVVAPRAAQAAEPSDPTRHYVGMNLWFLTDWDGSNAFADIMLHARAWSTAPWQSGVFAQRDADGWPLEDCATVIFGPDNQLGTYTLVFEGSAQSVSLMWTGGSVSNLTYDAATNTSTAEVTLTSNNTGGLTFTGTRRTAASPLNSGIRRVRLYRPGHASDGSEVFDQRFLNLMRNAQVIRFMDWVDANKNAVVEWSQRRNPGQAVLDDLPVDIPNLAGANTTGNRDIPIEYYILLCNELDADMWLNIPTLASDDYITKLAQAMRYGTDGVNPYTSPQANPVFPPLNAHLVIHLEYSNEIWNPPLGFKNFPWIRNLVDFTIKGAPYDHPIEFDGNEDTYTLMARYGAWRLVEASKLFRSVWGDAAINTRIRPALMGQIGGNWMNPRQLPWLDAFYNQYRPADHAFPNLNPTPIHHHLYSAGGSYYYEVNTYSTDPEVFFAADNYPKASRVQSIAMDAVRSMNYGLRRIAYEGGLGLDWFGRSGNPAATNDEKDALMTDPRMIDLQNAHHDVWTSMGGDLFVYYVNVGPSNWEFTPSVNQLDTPKLESLRQIVHERRRVPVTIGQEIPGVIHGRDQDATGLLSKLGGTFNVNDATGAPVLGGLTTGEHIGFPMNTRSFGRYRVTVRAGSNVANSFAFHLNGRPVAETATLAAGRRPDMINSSSIEILVDDEFSVLRIEPLAGEVYLHSITLEYLGPVDPGPERVIRMSGPADQEWRISPGPDNTVDGLEFPGLPQGVDQTLTPSSGGDSNG